MIICVFFKVGGCENNLERIIFMNAFLFSIGAAIACGMVQYLFFQKGPEFPDDFGEIFIASGWIYEIILLGGGFTVLSFKNLIFV
jgi:hypothetical protein